MPLVDPAPTTGFLFAFYHYSKLEHARLLEHVVRLLTSNDIIHVAVVPVWECVLAPNGPPRVHRLLASYHAYTSFVGYGFEAQDARTILEPQYELLFLPVHGHDAMMEGLSFLRGLRGAKYNYLTLPLTLLPRSWKPTYHATRIATEEEDEEGHVHYYYRHRDRVSTAAPSSSSQQRIFCSQMGLELCYICGALPRGVHDLDPAVCLPKELATILREKAGAIPCAHDRVEFESDDPDAEWDPVHHHHL